MKELSFLTDFHLQLFLFHFSIFTKLLQLPLHLFQPLNLLPRMRIPQPIHFILINQINLLLLLPFRLIMLNQTVNLMYHLKRQLHLLNTYLVYDWIFIQ